jgi:thioredoxin-related protein
MKNPFVKTPLLLAIGLLACSVTGRAEEKGPWLTDYSKAIELAKTENKFVLLDFSGSDWCGPCILFKREVLDTKEFSEYAAKNLILVEVDFPTAKHQPEKVMIQNEKLKLQYQVDPLPTLLLLDKNGKELGREEGYMPGGKPSAFIAKLNSFMKK